MVFKREVSLLCSSTHITGKLKLSRDPNVIYVGRKPPMSYVMGIITCFSGSNAEKVTLKARGRSISTAVDAAEIVRHRFLRDLSVGNITLGTEELPPREGESRPMNVSTIEITLTKEVKPNEEAKAVQKVPIAKEKVA